MFAFFPYLKTSKRVRYRGTTLRPVTDTEGLTPVQIQSLDELREMFFLRDNLRIEYPTYAVAAESASQPDIDAFRANLLELRELLSYSYSSLHDSFGDPFLRREHSTLFVFKPKEIFRSFFEEKHGTTAVVPLQLPDEDDRGHVPAYECEVDGQEATWVAASSRVYPPCVRLWLNIAQDLGHEWESFGRSSVFGPVFTYFEMRRADSELQRRFFTALTWYNRSIGIDTPSDVRLIHLATAFEALLGLPEGSGVTRRFSEAVLLLIGNVPKADLWADQFYRARSEIVHRGESRALMFRPDARQPDVGNRGYRPLISYGWFIFQVCAAAIASGALVARSQNLESFLESNSERFQRICKRLDRNETPAAERISESAEDIQQAASHRFVAEPDLAPALLIGTAQRLAATFLATGEASDLAEVFSKLAQSQTSDMLVALRHLRLVADAIEKHQWETAHEAPLRVIVGSLIATIWDYLFMLYFHLERTKVPQQP